MERELILICEGNLDGGFHSITQDPDVLYQDDSGLSHPMALHRSLWRAGNTVDVLGGGQIRSSFGFGNIVQNAICACR